MEQRGQADGLGKPSVCPLCVLQCLRIYPKMLKQYLFCLRVPQPPVSLTGLAQFFKQGICPAQIFKVINGRQRHIKLCVCKLFSAGNGGKIPVSYTHLDVYKRQI